MAIEILRADGTPIRRAIGFLGGFIPAVPGAGVDLIASQEIPIEDEEEDDA